MIGKVCCTPFIDNGMTGEERIVLQGLDEGDVGSSGTDDHVVDSVCFQQTCYDADVFHVIWHSVLQLFLKESVFQRIAAVEHNGLPHHKIAGA